MPIRSLNTNVMNLCHEDSPLQSPCWRVLLTKVPRGDEKSVFGTSSGTMRSCSYASEISMMVMKGWAATTSRIISWLGNGVESRTVLAFRSHASITVRSFSSFPALGMDSSGTAFWP